MSKNLKYFKRLGITPTTDIGRIKKAYRKKALLLHPDKNPSEDAQTKFIEITEAYEILTGLDSKKKETTSVKTAQEVKKDKLEEAQKRYAKMKASEKDRDAAYFEKMVTGRYWKVFKGLAIYSMFLSLLLTADYFYTGKKKAIPSFSTYSFIPRTIQCEEEIFIVDKLQYWTGQFPPTELNYSLLFEDLKSISIVDSPVNLHEVNIKRTKHPSVRLKKFDLFERYKSSEYYSYASIYYVFPYFQIFMCLPLFLVYYKRPNLNFVIGRLISLWIIFPAVIYLTFSNGRIFHFLGIL